MDTDSDQWIIWYNNKKYKNVYHEKSDWFKILSLFFRRLGETRVLYTITVCYHQHPTISLGLIFVQ